MRSYWTPLRYPGGKQKLAPFVHEILEANGLIGCHYAEPYAGGAGVAIHLLMEGKVSAIHLNDSSYPVTAFWLSILNESEEMCRRVSRASLTIKEWRRQREILRHPDEHSRLDVGFSTLFLNRCNRSGVLTGGVIGGLEQKGEWKIDARFPRNELIRRVEAIAEKSNRIKVHNMDAEAFVRRQVAKMPNASLVYFDPPYVEKAARLYLNCYKVEDHVRLANTIQGMANRHWLVSYDDAATIRAGYAARRRFTYDLQYNATKVYKGTEVFIFSDSLRIPTKSSLKFIDSRLNSLEALIA